MFDDDFHTCKYNSIVHACNNQSFVLSTETTNWYSFSSKQLSVSHCCFLDCNAHILAILDSSKYLVPYYAWCSCCNQILGNLVKFCQQIKRYLDFVCQLLHWMSPTMLKILFCKRWLRPWIFPPRLVAHK